jgi:hypothetical protein
LNPEPYIRKDVVLFAYKTLLKAAEATASTCAESKLKDVGVVAFRMRCGAGVMEGAERALRKRAARSRPAGDAGDKDVDADARADADAEANVDAEVEGSTGGDDEEEAQQQRQQEDADLVAVVKMLVAAQRAAFVPVLVAAMSAFSKVGACPVYVYISSSATTRAVLRPTHRCSRSLQPGVRVVNVYVHRYMHSKLWLSGDTSEITCHTDM